MSAVDIQQHFRANSAKLLANVTTRLAALTDQNVTERIRHAVHLRHALTEREYDLLCQAYPTAVIVNGSLSGGGHGLFRAFHDMACVTMSRMSKRGNHIEIGPNPYDAVRHHVRGRHYCCLWDSPADQMRAVRADLLIGDLEGLDADQAHAAAEWYLAREGHRTDTWCSAGFENCNHRAEVGYAMHSTYDIPLRTLARGMSRHGIRRVVAWMLIPAEALLVPSYTNTKWGYTYKLRTAKGNHDYDLLEFYFNGEPGNAYVHNRRIWLEYLTTTIISLDVGCFALTVEAKNGPQYQIHIYAIVAPTTTGHFLTRYVDSGLEDMVLVPDLYQVLLNPKDVGLRPSTIVTSRDKVAKMLMFAYSRDPGSLDFRTLMIYARSIANSVTIAGYVLNNRWEGVADDGDLMMRLVYAIWVVATIGTARIDRATKHFNAIMATADSRHSAVIRADGGSAPHLTPNRAIDPLEHIYHVREFSTAGQALFARDQTLVGMIRKWIKRGFATADEPVEGEVGGWLRTSKLTELTVGALAKSPLFAATIISCAEAFRTSSEIAARPILEAPLWLPPPPAPLPPPEPTEVPDVEFYEPRAEEGADRLPRAMFLEVPDAVRGDFHGNEEWRQVIAQDDDWVYLGGICNGPSLYPQVPTAPPAEDDEEPATARDEMVKVVQELDPKVWTALRADEYDGDYRCDHKIAELLTHVPDDVVDVLDVGAGPGRFSKHMSERGMRVTAVCHPRRPLQDQSWAEKQIVADVRSANFRIDEQYDLVITDLGIPEGDSQVEAWMPLLRAAMAIIIGNTRPGGCAIMKCLTPECDSLRLLYYRLSQFFGEFAWSKPAGSRATNAEVYLVLRNKIKCRDPAVLSLSDDECLAMLRDDPDMGPVLDDMAETLLQRQVDALEKALLGTGGRVKIVGECLPTDDAPPATSPPRKPVMIDGFPAPPGFVPVAPSAPSVAPQPSVGVQHAGDAVADSDTEPVATTASGAPQTPPEQPKSAPPAATGVGGAPPVTAARPAASATGPQPTGPLYPQGQHKVGQIVADQTSDGDFYVVRARDDGTVRYEQVRNVVGKNNLTFLSKILVDELKEAGYTVAPVTIEPGSFAKVMALEPIDVIAVEQRQFGDTNTTVLRVPPAVTPSKPHFLKVRRQGPDFVDYWLGHNPQVLGSISTATSPLPGPGRFLFHCAKNHWVLYDQWDFVFYTTGRKAKPAAWASKYKIVRTPDSTGVSCAAACLFNAHKATGGTGKWFDTRRAISAWLYHHFAEGGAADEVITPEIMEESHQLMLQEMAIAGPELKAFHDRIRRNLTTAPEVPSNLNVIVGPPGSGKTALLAKRFASKATCYLAPTNQLVHEQGGKFTRAMTHRQAFRKPAGAIPSAEVAILDECFTLTTAEVAHICARFSEVWAIGDPMQIGWIDFANVVVRRSHGTLFAEVYQPYVRETLKVSHRCPQDIMSLLAHHQVYDGFSSTNRVDKSITPWEGRPVGQQLVFTQAMKARYPDAITVHEAQGGTWENVTLHIGEDDRGLLAKSRCHIVVALTRHTKRLILHDETGGDLVKFLVPPDVEYALECARVPVATTERPREERVIATPAVEERASIQSKPDLALVEETLQGVARVNPNRVQNVAMPHVRHIGPVKAGSITVGNLAVEDNSVTSTAKPRKVRRFKHLQSRTVNQHGQNKMFTLRCLVERYCGLIQKTDDSQVEALAQKLRLAYYLAVDEKKFAIQHEQVLEGFITSAKKFDMKHKDVATIQALMADNTYNWLTSTFFTKRQQKGAVGDDSAMKTIVKAGQGICDAGKAMWALCIPWVKAFVEAEQRALKKGVLATQNRPRHEVANEWHDIIANNPDLEVFNADFPSWDMSNDKVIVRFLMMLWHDAGVPEPICRLMALNRDVCRILWFGGKGEHRLMARVSMAFKQISGSANTLAGNTSAARAVTYAVLDGIEVSANLGDDVTVAARRGRLSTRPEMQRALSTKFTLPAPSDTADFLGTLANVNGASIDIVRCAIKLSSKAFNSRSEYNEYQVAVRDWIRGINGSNQHAAFQTVAKYYGITEGAVEILFNFLQRFSLGDYKWAGTTNIDENWSVTFAPPEPRTDTHQCNVNYHFLGDLRPDTHEMPLPPPDTGKTRLEDQEAADAAALRRYQQGEVGPLFGLDPSAYMPL